MDLSALKNRPFMLTKHDNEPVGILNMHDHKNYFVLGMCMYNFEQVFNAYQDHKNSCNVLLHNKKTQSVPMSMFKKFDKLMQPNIANLISPLRSNINKHTPSMMVNRAQNLLLLESMFMTDSILHKYDNKAQALGDVQWIESRLMTINKYLTDPSKKSQIKIPLLNDHSFKVKYLNDPSGIYQTRIIINTSKNDVRNALSDVIDNSMEFINKIVRGDSDCSLVLPSGKSIGANPRVAQALHVLLSKNQNLSRLMSKEARAHLNEVLSGLKNKDKSIELMPWTFDIIRSLISYYLSFAKALKSQPDINILSKLWINYMRVADHIEYTHPNVLRTDHGEALSKQANKLSNQTTQLISLGYETPDIKGILNLRNQQMKAFMLYSTASVLNCVKAIRNHKIIFKVYDMNGQTHDGLIHGVGREYHKVCADIASSDDKTTSLKSLFNRLNSLDSNVAIVDKDEVAELSNYMTLNMNYTNQYTRDNHMEHLCTTVVNLLSYLYAYIDETQAFDPATKQTQAN